MKNNKAVTLVALIITVIILLILAGVVIAMTIGDEGIINKSQQAVEKYNEATAREKVTIMLTEYAMERTNSTKTLEEYLKEQKTKGELNKVINNNDGTITVEVDGYELTIYENFEIVLNVPQESELTEFEKLQQSYVQEGLVVWYDGIYNTKEGHNKAVNKWEDLTGNNNNGTLINVNNTPKSGWNDNSLILDGIDDWVKMTYIKLENVTVEIVVRPLDIDTKTQQFYVANVENGGIGVYKNADNKNESIVGINGSYNKCISNENIKFAQIYSISAGYDGNCQYLSENGISYINNKTGKYSNPVNSTRFALGTNPAGTGMTLYNDEKLSNIEIYSVRIYNRCLTKEEIQQNYNIDKARFGIE